MRNFATLVTTDPDLRGGVALAGGDRRLAADGGAESAGVSPVGCGPGREAAGAPVIGLASPGSRGAGFSNFRIFSPQGIGRPPVLKSVFLLAQKTGGGMNWGHTAEVRGELSLALGEIAGQSRGPGHHRNQYSNPPHLGAPQRATLLASFSHRSTALPPLHQIEASSWQRCLTNAAKSCKRRQTLISLDITIRSEVYESDHRSSL